MSTKTTFKRVALVAVAALGLGVMSVAPSNAAAQLDSLAVSLASTTQDTTDTLTATASVLTATLAGIKGVDTLTVTASIVSGPAYVQPILALKETTTAASSGTGTSAVTVTPLDTTTVTQATGKFNVYLNAPSVVGTYVVKLTPTGGVNAAAVTVSIVVSKKVYAAVSATHSRVWMKTSTDGGVIGNGGNNVAYFGASGNYSAIYNAGGSDANKDAFYVTTGTVALAANGTPIASLAIIPRNESGSATTLTVSPITVAITSGPGYVGVQDALVRGKSITESVATSGADGYDPGTLTKNAYIWSDGTAGVTTVTVSMAGVLLKTLTINQIGTAAAYVFGTPTKSVVGVTESMTVAVTGADSLGTTTGAASVYAFSSDTSVATVNSTQASTVVVTGVKSGTATITVGNASTLATSTITKTLAVKVGAVTAKTVTVTFSPSAPTAGEKVTVTVKALDASGNAVGDGVRALYAAGGFSPSVSVNGSTLPATTTETLTAGVATYIFYAPTAGTVTFTATEGTATDSTTKGTITGSVVVSNPGLDAATDAANEAIDAANAATDAALAAAEAADAATSAAQEASDAVAALSETVTKLISDLTALTSALQAQIKSLAATVAKIAKKVKA